MKKIICNCALTVLLVFTSSHSFASNVLLDLATTNSSEVDFYPWSTVESYSYGNVISPESDMNVGSFSFQMSKITSIDTVAQPFKAYIYKSDSVGVLSGNAIAQSNETTSTNSTTFTEVKAELTSTAALSSDSYYTLIFNVVGVSGAPSSDKYRWLTSNVIDSQAVGSWYSNDNSDGISAASFGDFFKFALKVYEADVMVVKKPRGTGPGGKDLNYFKSIAYFGLTPVFTKMLSPS